MTLCFVLMVAFAAGSAPKDNYFPKLVEVVAPQVSPDSDPNGGAMVVIHIGKDGHVSNVEALHSSGGAAPPIVEAIKRWVFEPLVRDGVPAESEVRVYLRLVPSIAARRSPRRGLTPVNPWTTWPPRATGTTAISCITAT